MRKREDEAHMKRALSLARRGAGRTHPNPMVGSVVVKGRKTLGEGWHRGPGQPHAETLALRAAGREARGATLYVNLEPCCHYGRTAPCTEAIRESGIVRVVAACMDPHYLVNGEGFRRLRAAGVQVEAGLFREKAEELNRAFLHFARKQTPYVTLKMASTMDGRIADGSGRSKWITGPEARRAVHRLRAEVDAILVGVETVLADDPRLDVRGVRRRATPLRVVLDPRFQTPLEARVVAQAGDGRTVLIVEEGTGPGRRAAYEDRGVRFLDLGTESGFFPWAALAGALVERDVLHLLVEGGSRTATCFLLQSAVNRIELFMASRLLGETGIPSVGDLGIRSLEGTLNLQLRRCRRIGGDVHLVADV